MKTRMTQKQLRVKTKVRTGKPPKSGCYYCERYHKAGQVAELEKCFSQYCK